MRVALFGGTGFVGSYLTTKLIEHKYKLSLLVRSEHLEKDSRSSDIKTTNGSINSVSAVNRTLGNCDYVIYNIGILEEVPKLGITFQSIQFDGLKAVVDQSVKLGVKKFILMSANGAKSVGTNYQVTKYNAEEYLKNSGLVYTILRPSVIFGDPQGKMEFITQLYQELITPPLPAVNFFKGFLPIQGSVKMSPVHIDDVVEVFCLALKLNHTNNKTYNLGGPEILSWYEILKCVAATTKKNKIFIPVPIVIMKLLARLFQWLPFFPVTFEQLQMLEENNIADKDELIKLIKRESRALTQDSIDYLVKI
jgi:NADH dehydrogenase